MIRKISKYDHHFEIVVSQIDMLNGKHRAVVHYEGLPYPKAIEDSYNVEEAIDKAIRKLLKECTLKAAEHLN